MPSPIDRRTTLVRSRYLERIPLDTGRVLCLHAVAMTRLVFEPEVDALFDCAATPQAVGDWLDDYCARYHVDPGVVLRTLQQLVEQRLLFPGTPEEEERATRALASQLYGRDPSVARAAALRAHAQPLPRFVAPIALGHDRLAPSGRRLDVILVGLCDVQIELDILRDEARGLGIDLHAVPILETTLDVLADAPHDAVVVGALGARHGHWFPGDGGLDLAPERYLRAARDLLERIRRRTRAAILIHNLPVPTCSPLGHADRGPSALAARCRRTNDGLRDLAAEIADTHVVDVDAALSFEGKRTLLDDRVMTFSHLGGLGWWTQLPAVEAGTVYGLTPPVARLAELGVTDPFAFDRTVVAAQLSLVAAIFGVGRRDAVVTWADGTLWPGRLSETGSPFPRGVDFGIWSYHSFHVGVHEALKAVAERGIRLGIVLDGDIDLLRGRWSYPVSAPLDRLVSADDAHLVTGGGGPAVERVRQALEGLGVDAGRAAYVDADPGRREAVAEALPGLLLLGENPFRVRGTLLTHPSLERVELAGDPVEHPSMLVALARRERERRAAADPRGFESSLQVRCTISRGVSEDDLDRLHELVARTNQFTTTARRFARQELAAFGRDAARGLYTLRVTDRFAEYGLAGAAVSIHDTIELLLLSCRVVALGVDQVLVRAVLGDLLTTYPAVNGRVLDRPKNAAARSVFRTAGFTRVSDDVWTITKPAALARPPLPAHLDAERRGLEAPPGFPWMIDGGSRTAREDSNR